jgi:uncharacterized protein involved in exopolysaccharide biosynthesis
MEKLREEYAEKEGNYRDRGWERDYRSMERLEEQIDKIDAFMNGRSMWRDAATSYKNKIERYEIQHKILKNLARELENESFTSPALRQTIREIDKL